MSTMHALKFFAEILCGAGFALIAVAWIAVYFLHRKTGQRLKEREEAHPRLFNAMVPHR